MEFLPVLEPLDKPKTGIWYSLMPKGSVPGVSVGHTCTFASSEDGQKGKIIIVGGANPSGSFSHTHIINLDNYEWEVPDWKGLKPRYEHCTFVPENCPQSLWVFGGAEQCGNRSCIQNIRFTDGEPRWNDLSVGGKTPSPRTYHTNTACLGDKLFVFSGGEAGAEAVSDQKLNVFDTVTSTWSQPDTEGRQPPPRHGHVIVGVGSKVFVHGGMTGNKFFSDMYCLHTENMKWEKVQTKGDIPAGVAAHAAVVLGKNIYIFGGMTANGATNQMFRFNTEKSRWLLMKFGGDLPPNRLDHSMCVLPWTVQSSDDGNNPVSSDTKHLAFVFGGMDTEGILHNDCVVTVLT